MAVSMRRMNGSWRGMALALVLCTLLLHNEVHCQDSIDTPHTSDAKDAPGAAPTASPGAAPTDVPGAAPTAAPGAAPTAAPGAAPTNATGVPAHADDTQGTDATIEPQAPVDDKATTVANSAADNTSGTSTPVPDQDTTFTPVPDQDTAFTSMVPDHDPLATGDTSGTTADTSGTTAGPGVDTQGTEATDDPGAPIVHQAPVFVLPTVECVDKEAVKDKDTVKVELSSETSCSVTKRIMEDSAWCTGDCNLKLFQEDNSNTLVLTRSNGGVKDLSESLNSQDIKGQLGVVKAAPQWGKHSSTVLVSLLVTGLLLAAALIGGYCLKKHWRHNAKGMRLAEDAYPVDEENQGNTLVSVAPLNPLETREKPANGDSQEAAKTQPPPTNGHSTANLADTEL